MANEQIPELKPCPFCGCDECRDDIYIRDGREVQCPSCGASMHAFNPDANQKAIAAWNTRVPTTELREGQMHLAMELEARGAELKRTYQLIDHWHGESEQKDEQIRKLREALGMLYDKWENGLPCQEACDGQIDDDSPCIGNAFRLSLAEEQTILNLIITGPAEFEQACANCGKPYRAHLLHDRNKCSVEGDAAWFPENIATAITANRAALKEGE